ncbi:hypothetical protein ACVIM8_005730 [Bradyrhizobium sp. USDA 4529]
MALRGNRLPFGDQESVGCDAERGVMVKAAPVKVAKTGLLLELRLVAFDAIAQLGKANERRSSTTTVIHSFTDGAGCVDGDPSRRLFSVEEQI